MRRSSAAIETPSGTSRRRSGRAAATARIAFLLALAGAVSGCARLGYTDRVLLRVPSPDDRFLAVCQEVPAFDGPGFTVRLETPDGAIVRQLYEIGDADGCSEMTWSPDGRLLAVLTGHVARIRFIDVEWALAHQATATAYWSWRQVDLGSEQQFTLGRGLRFTGPAEFELQTCAYSLETLRRTRTWSCLDAPVTRRMAVPQPVVTGHPERLARE